jgi:hypothetical protein
MSSSVDTFVDGGAEPLEKQKDTDLPSGKLQVRLSAAFSIETDVVLEGPANRARSNGKVSVVAVSQVADQQLHTKNTPEKDLCRIREFKTYVKPAAFQAVVILKDGGCEDGGSCGLRRSSRVELEVAARRKVRRDVTCLLHHVINCAVDRGITQPPPSLGIII